MPPFSYSYQLEPYTYRVVPYPLPIRHRHDGGWGNGAAAAGYGHYPPDYYSHHPAPPTSVGPVRSHPRPWSRNRPVLSEEQKLQNLRERLIKQEPADRHIPPAPPLEATPPPVAKAPTPDPAPEAPPPVEQPPPLPPKEETATEITPTKELHYPSKLHRERVAKLHARNDKARRSTQTVFVIVHEVDGVNIDIQVSRSLKDANHEVLRIMARYHPRTFKLTPLKRKVGIPAAAADNVAASGEEGDDGGVIKTEAGNNAIDNGLEEGVVIVDDDGEDSSTMKEQEKEEERKRRFVYCGEWKFTHASTLKLEAKIGNQVVKISSALKTVRNERKDPKQGKT